MGLIKSNDAPAGLTAFSMQDIEAAARRILLRANQKADQIIAAAQTEAVGIRTQAKSEGHAEGKKAGLIEGIEQGKKTGHAQALAEHGPALSKLIETIGAAIRQLEISRDDLETRGLVGVIELAGSLARRVAKRQGQLDPQVLKENLKEAMSLVVHAADIRIAVHPTQKQTLALELPHLKLAWPQLKHVELLEDAALAPGGVRVFTAAGMVDGDLDVQLDNLLAELMPAGGEG